MPHKDIVLFYRYRGLVSKEFDIIERLDFAQRLTLGVAQVLKAKR